MRRALLKQRVGRNTPTSGKHCLLRLEPDSLLDKTREARLSAGDLSIFTSDLYGFWLMGRCIPSTCSMKDVDVGFVNFLHDLAEWLEANQLSGIKLPNVTFKALNCHTEEEGGKAGFYSKFSEILKSTFQSN